MLAARDSPINGNRDRIARRILQRLRLPLHLFRLGSHPLFLHNIVQTHSVRFLLDLVHLFPQFPCIFLQFLPRLLILLLQRLLHLLLKFLQLMLLSSHLLVEFPVDNFSSRGVTDLLVFINQLSLNLQYDRILLDNPSNDVVSGFCGVVMTSHLRALVEDRLEEIVRELVLAILTILGRDLAPHVRDQNDVLQRLVTAEFPERVEIASGDSGEPFVGDAVDIDGPGNLAPVLIPGKKLSPELSTKDTPLCLRSCQVSCDQL